jgi:hypothetical protein
MDQPKFTVDNMLYQMCVSSAWREEFDMSTASYTEYHPDGSIRIRQFETVDIPMDTELTLMDKFSALELIQSYTDNDELIMSAMHNHNSFATREGDAGKIVMGWNDRSK